jgi:hypothetical protein
MKNALPVSGATESDESCDDMQAALESLASLISGQLAAANEGDCDKVLALGTQIDQALKDALPFDEVSPKGAALLRQIVDKRRKLVLKLASQKAETARELSRLRRGRAGLRGYRQSTGA